MEPPRPERPAPQPTSRPARPPRPAPVRDTVEIPRAWLAPIAGGVLVVLLIVVYLLGKESGRRATEAARVDPAVASATGTEAPAPPVAAPPTPVPWPPLGTSTGAAAPLATWPPEERPSDTNQQRTGWNDPVAPSSAADPQAAAVEAYLAEIEAYGQQASSSSPQELAMTLMGQGMQGDTSGFEQLLETQRTAQRQIESMTVPLPCQEHHRRTLAALRQSLALGEKLGRGMTSGDLGGLLSLSGEARQLEAVAGELEALAAQLRRRFGLPS